MFLTPKSGGEIMVARVLLDLFSQFYKIVTSYHHIATTTTPKKLIMNVHYVDQTTTRPLNQALQHIPYPTY